MREEKVPTKNPDTKRVLKISKSKYGTILKSILVSLKTKSMTHTELVNSARKSLEGKFEGSFGWYVQIVKRDLEIKKIIERIPNTSPQLYRLRK